jgi:Tol biopolymer transport system component
MYDTETGNYGFLVEPGIFPKWNPQGTILAFNWGQTIYFYYPDTRYVRQVSDSGEIFVFSWSFDGTKLIFNGCYRGACGCLVVDTLGNRIRNVLPDDYPVAGVPSWSQAGDRILLSVSDSLTRTSIILIDTLGNIVREVLANQDFDISSVIGWSPEENRMALGATYVDGQGFTFSDLRVYDMQGQRERILTADAGMPQWSPDGSKIVFQKYTWMAPSRNPMLEPDCGRVTVWTCNPDGSDMHELLDWPQPEFDSTMFGGGYNWLNPPRPQ